MSSKNISKRTLCVVYLCTYNPSRVDQIEDRQKKKLHPELQAVIQIPRWSESPAATAEHTCKQLDNESKIKPVFAALKLVASGNSISF